MKLERFTMQLVAAGLIALPLGAHAAGLGKLSVTSALGQPLVAEIELFAADKAELDSLSASLASETAFRDARVDLAPVLSTLRFTIEKKPGGKAVLKVSSTRPVNDPFIDMLVELNWASGRIVREYTMLLDPPGMAVAQTVSPVVVAPQAPASEPTPASVFAIAPEPAPEAIAEPVAEPAPQAQPEPTPQAVAEAAPEPAPKTVAEAAPEPAPQTTSEPPPQTISEPPPEAAPESAPETVAEAAPVSGQPAAEPEAAQTAQSAPQEAAESPDSVAVKRGDTLSGIASRVRPQGVSLEQALLGLYRDNPQAFAGNMNRLKAGQTLKVPSEESLTAIPQKEAAREVRLQAADWNAYRQKLASAVSATPEAEPASAQAASGKITPKVEDRAQPAAEAQQDVLKLSKAAPAAETAAAAETRALQEKLRAQEEDAAAREKALQEAGQRVAMLEKQIEDMRKLAEMRETQAEAAAPEAQAPAPGPEASQADAAPEPAAEAAAPMEAPAADEEPAFAVPAEGVPEAPVPADNWYDPFLADPLYWGGGLAALGLGGVLWWMMAGSRRRKAGNTLEDSIMTGGDLRPGNAMALASGGSVNTGDSSFLTDFSQAGLGNIDTHDVDPIAEAEVYMAYGRDAQAEEILREAIGKNPDRHEIRVKLLEIFAAQRNTAAFEAVAGELYAALGTQPSSLWDKACEMGRDIDPSNPLYGGAQASKAPGAATVAASAVVAGGAVSFADEPKPAAVEPEPAVARAPEPPRVESAPVFEAAPDNGLLDFETAGEVLDFDAQPMAAAAPAKDTLEVDTQGLAFELPDLDLPAASDDALKFDLGTEGDNDSKYDFSGFDLDLGDVGADALDEVGTKLDLARAYVEMGDKEGAREILDEVLAEGNDKQKADAKGLLVALG